MYIKGEYNMGLFNKKTPNQTQGEQILKQIVGTKRMKNTTLYQRISSELGYRKTHKLLDNVISEIKHELEHGMIGPGEVEDRVYQLIESGLGHPLMDTNHGKRVSAEYTIKIPYQSSGVKGYANMGGGALLGSSIGEGVTRWRTTTLFVHDYGVEVKSTGQQIRFSDVVDVRSGDDGGLLINTVKLVLFFGDGGQFVMKVMASDVDVLLDLFQDNLGSIDNSEGNVSSADELLKYADLLERGLITREEFEMKKRELM